MKKKSLAFFGAILLSFIVSDSAQTTGAMRTSVTLRSDHTPWTKIGDVITLSGEVTPRPSVPPGPIPLQVSVQHPDGTYAYDGVLLSDSLWKYQLPVTVENWGIMRAEVKFLGDAIYRESGSEMLIPVPRPIGMAIVVAGNGQYSTLFPSIEYLCDTAVDAFFRRNIPDDPGYPDRHRIWYMHPDLSHDLNYDGIPEVDAVPTLANLTWAIKNWAPALMQTKDASGNWSPNALLDTPLTIYLIGSIKEDVLPQNSTFLFDLANESDSISAATLNALLDELEDSIKQQFNDAGMQPPQYVPINVVIEGPTSGDFIPSLSKQGRFVITSTDSHVRGTDQGGKSYMAAGGSISFTAYFLSRISVGSDIPISFAYAQYNILSTEALKLQKPQLEGSGNGISNEIADEIATASEYLEYRPYIGARPRLQNALGGIALYDVHEAKLWAYAYDAEDNLKAVEALVIPPDGSFEEPHALALMPNLSWPGRYEGIYDKFYGEGIYTLVYNAVDEAGNIAVPITKHVIVEDTQPPLDVSNLSIAALPADTFTLGWVSSESPDTQGYRIYLTPPGGAESLWRDAGNMHEVTFTKDDVPATPGILTFNVKAYDRVPLESAGVSTTLTIENNPPIAEAGTNRTVEAISAAGASVQLDGSVSSDPDGDTLTFLWSGPFGTATGPTPTVTLPLGTNTIVLEVTDESGATSTDSVDIDVVDTTPPSLTVPASITAEATSPAGAVVTYPAATATDAVSTPTITYSKPSGSVFPLGLTSVTATAKDAAGNTLSKAFNITVVDTTPPSLKAPPDIQVAEGDPRGTSIDLGQPTVNDICDTNPIVGNNAPALFGLGETIVTWTATDASGNVSTALQKVTVVSGPPGNQLTNLAKLVQYSVASGGIAPDLQAGLLAKVSASSDALARGNIKAAVNNLRLFISQVEAQMGKKISQAVATVMINRASQIIAALGG